MEGVSPKLTDCDMFACEQRDASDLLRLVRQVFTAVSALPVEVDGADEYVQELANFHGLQPSEAFVVKLRSNTRSFTLIAATTRAWEQKRPALLSTKHDARRARRHVLLTPAGWVRRPAFLDNCALIGTSRSLRITATDRMAIIARVRETPGVSLEDCALEIASHDDPVGAVLKMVGEGLLRMDLRTPMSPDICVSVSVS
ncbi:MAG: hypothetical protein DI565_16565 [Ancylobacter novellus]|jgi:hypothetical protein|uniref:Uncharacterized protein n=1 Tax=Ancylobacter novellus TaxID=921 RepID=A0A2W5M4V9_ANCNO|nr:MAG: hypothetical protein DI565_16565 [Ancylobacter novellus]